MLWGRGIHCIVLLLTLLTIMDIGSQSAVAIDPAPLTKILSDALASIIDRDYNTSLFLCYTALDISLPPDLNYIHQKLYRKLIETIEILRVIDRDGGSRLDTIYHLYILRGDIMELLKGYVNRLSNYFVSQEARRVMIGSVDIYIDRFDSELEVLIGRLIQLYIHGYGEGLDIYIEHPKSIPGGARYAVSIKATSRVDVENVSIHLLAEYGDVLSRDIDIDAPVGRWVDIELDAPSAEELISIGIAPAEIVTVRFSVFARTSTSLFGYTTSNASVVYEVPPIEVTAPDELYPNQRMDIAITANVDTPIELAVYIDRIARENILLNTTIDFGFYNYSLTPPALATGYHSIIFTTKPRGRYLPYTYTHRFLVVRHPMQASISSTKLALTPIARPHINIQVDRPIPYSVVVYVDGEKVEYRYINSTRIVLEAPSPPAILIGWHRLRVEIVPTDPLYNPYSVEGYIYVINIPIAVALMVVTAITFTTQSGEGYVAVVFSAVDRLWRTVLRSRVAKGHIGRALGYTFREPKLLHLYRRLIRMVSRHLEPPQKAETLREFCNRVGGRIGGLVGNLVKEFLDLYEKDLYSNHDVDVVKAEGIIRRIEEVEG